MKSMENQGHIQIEELFFSYTPRQPLIRDMSFHVSTGEIFGFLGPSGAGKSTLQKILTGVLNQYTGSVLVNGQEVKSRNGHFYEEIGVDFEFPSLYGKFTALENLDFFGSLYQKELLPANDLLEMVGLQHDAHRRVSDFSKGMKSRLNFIIALIHQPQMLFLDEPTSGLDPSNARQMKNIILDQKKQGKTIILTTHNMHDAAEVCDRVAFIVDGQIRALDTPHRLIMKKGGQQVTYRYLEKEQEQVGTTPLNQLSQDLQLQQLMADNRILSIHSSEPTLEDVFIDVTGRSLQ